MQRHLDVGCALTLLAASLCAGTGRAAEREHGPHEHGHGTLQVALDGDRLVIELQIPAVNVVGFEHPPGTDAERDAVRHATDRFSRGEDLFAPTEAALCRLASYTVELEGMDAARGHDGTHAGPDHGAVGEIHSELHAQYSFQCASPRELERLEVKVFEYLHEAEELDAQVVTPSLQTQTELRPGASSLRLVR